MRHASAVIALLLLLAPARASADLTKEQILAAYGELEKKLGTPAGDPSTAFAAFMVGCHVAYSSAAFPEEAQFAALRQQVKPQVDAMLAKAGAQRVAVIEYLAVTGMSFVIHRAALDRRADPKRAAALREEAERVMAQNKIDPKSLAEVMSKLGTAPIAAPPAKPAPAAAPVKLDTDALRKQIVGISITYQRTYDGEYVGYAERTFLMLDNGWASNTLSAALDPGGLAAHRAAIPRKWLQWRKTGSGTLQICDDKCDVPRSWRALTSEMMTPSLDPVLPKGFRIAGSYKSVGGGTVGGTTALRFGFWTFEANGRFSTSSAGTVTVNTHVTGQGDRQIANGGRTSASVGGTYEIDGVVLTLRYDDGRVDYRTITTTQKPKPSSVTINGTMFNRM